MAPSNAKEDYKPLMERVGELNKYLIDLKGYLVINNALSKEEIDDLNNVIDAQFLPPPTTYNRFGTAPLGAGFLGWNPAFAALIDHPSVLDILQFLLGPTIILRSIHGLYEERFVGKLKENTLHSNSKAGIELGLSCSIVWNLTDTGPGIGGFCCIEGSHHVRYDPPASIKDASPLSSHIVTPDAPAGSAIVCMSRLSHSSAPWTGPHQRRSLVLEYATSADDPNRRITLPTFELTRRQLGVLGHTNE